MLVAFDTNVLAYGAGVLKAAEDEKKAARSYEIILALADHHQCVLPTQVLGELFNVLRKYHRDDRKALAIAMNVADECHLVAAAPSSLRHALQLAAAHRMQIWDAVILATAADSGCNILLSEDMQSGFVWGGVTVINPFADALHPQLAVLLNA